MRNCQQVSAALSAWLDHEVPAADAVEIQAHVEQCSACRAEQARLQRLESALKTALEHRSAPITFDVIWKEVEQRIQRRLPWYERWWDRLGFDFAPSRPVWVVSVAAVLLLGVFSVARYFPEWRSNNFAFVESIDAHGSNVALFREAETRTTVIWLFEDLETQDEAAEQAVTNSPGF
jgi:anti-sigma factor RsiW